MAESVLLFRLAHELPQELRLIIHHLSSQPLECPCIFAPPPGYAPKQTYCESQFLSVSIDHNKKRVHCFALEVLIYTSEDLTIIFISKADSTGYFHLQDPGKGHVSPLRSVFSTFLSYLVESRQRPNVRLVLSLFARAQDQYLFPGSIENKQKHVLDDRGLIKWWCKVLDAVLRRFPPESLTLSYPAQNNDADGNGVRSRGYLKVPGCDTYETRAFIPDYARLEKQSPRWKIEDPLRLIGKPPGIPERCLIPRFPDDPKARFVIDLDDELPENQPQLQESPSKSQAPGKWRSVQSLEQFWEMMAFRQECAAGRLVGFVWGVFTPFTLLGLPFDSQAEVAERSLNSQQTTAILPAAPHSQGERVLLGPSEIPLPSSPPPIPSLLPMLSQPPEDRFTSAISSKITAETKELNDANPQEPKEVTSFPKSENSPRSVANHWPLACRGEVVLPEIAYKSVCNLLLTLDYSDETLAATSTKQWIDAVAKTADLDTWGQAIVGQKPTTDPEYPKDSTCSGPATLSSSLLRKKKRPIETAEIDVTSFSEGQHGVPQVLSGSLIRKKTKISTS
ncbi:hypothetical protein MMC14_002979 [Varicellaria rhodocarpa]|nr:hypothetical protein [Varicellaria rhodocarpa]